MRPTSPPPTARAEPRLSRWWIATLVATFLWLCVAYVIGNKCGGMGLVGPCQLIMYESPMTAYAGVAWVAVAIFFIPVLALVALVQTFRRAMQPLPPEQRDEPGL